MFNNIPPITKNLIIINLLVFFAGYVLETKGISLTSHLAAFYPDSENFKSWQIITHMFVHGGISHLLFNMFGLYMFGSTVEKALGDKKFIVLYFAAGLGSFALYNLVNYVEALQYINNTNLDFHILENIRQLKPGYFINTPELAGLSKIYSTPMVGASGAIYGILVAFGVLYSEVKLSIIFLPFISLKAKHFIPIILLLDLLGGIGSVGNVWNSPIAHFAHIGGAIVGFLIIYYWKKNQQKWN